MKLTMQLIRALAALSGQPIRMSSVAAPDNDPDSIVIAPDPRAKISPSRNSRSYKGLAYADHAPKLRMDILTPSRTGSTPARALSARWRIRVRAPRSWIASSNFFEPERAAELY